MKKTRSRSGLIVLIVLVVTIAVFGVSFAVSDTVRFVTASMVSTLLYGFPTVKDFHDATAIREVITNTHHFARNSVSQPDRPPVFSNPGSTNVLTQSTVIQVYEVRDSTEQDKIISAVKKLVDERKCKPVELQFYDHENWPSENESYRERGPEVLLCRFTITDIGVKEKGGNRLITYPSP